MSKSGTCSLFKIKLFSSVSTSKICVEISKGCFNTSSTLLMNCCYLKMTHNLLKCLYKYEGESVNRSQMDIKLKHVILEPGKNIFLDISSTNIDTLDPALYQCVETRNTELTVLYIYLKFFNFSTQRHSGDTDQCSSLFCNVRFFS
jgi:hypothetical protein